MLLLFILFFTFMFLKMPVAFSMLCSSVIVGLWLEEPLGMMLTRALAGPSSFTLLALGFFILAGNIMNTGGITDRIFGFCKKLVGWIPGGLGHANVVASVIFAGMSGAAVADAGGLGAIEIKAMKDDGYDEPFAVAVTGGSSILGPIIPPSINMVVLAVGTGLSVGKLFVAGLLPGCVMALVMMVYIFIIAKKRHYPRTPREGAGDLVKSFFGSLPALLTPVIILGGIFSGVCTPTEASVVAVVYSLFLSLTTRELSIRDVPRMLDEAVTLTMSVLFIVAAANAFGFLITASQLPQTLAGEFVQIISSKYVGMFLINIFLLGVGMFMETLSAQIILTPILFPVAISLGVDPLHFGVIMVLALVIGMITPPVGMVLYVLTNMSRCTFEQISKAIMPFIFMNVISLFIVTFVPSLVTFLPNLLLGE